MGSNQITVWMWVGGKAYFGSGDGGMQKSHGGSQNSDKTLYLDTWLGYGLLKVYGWIYYGNKIMKITGSK